MSDAPRRLAYQPALDGLRAVAVLLVLGFHLEVPGLGGGYLGVSVFFTLSGFLITHLLLAELERTGSIDVGGYIVRRLRRLLPASLLGLLLVVVLTTTGALPESQRLRGSIWAALAQVANWRDLLGGQSYADLFAAPSPIAHYWSLAIEEQFYWLWPLAVLATVRVARHRASGQRRGHAANVLRLTAIAFVLTAVSAPLTSSWWSPDAAYLATWARAAEILAGAVVAAWMRSGRSVVGVARWTPLALAVVIVAAVVTPAGSGWAYQGGLPLFAVASALLLAGLQHPSPAKRALSWRPLVWLGTISYGVYVYHWPLVVWLDEHRTGLDGVSLAALRLAATLLAAVVSYRFVEQPIRTSATSAGWPWRRAAPVAAVGSVAVALAAILVPVALTPPPAPAVLAAPAVATPSATRGAASPRSDRTTPATTPDATTGATSVEPTTAKPTTTGAASNALPDVRKTPAPADDAVAGNGGAAGFAGDAVGGAAGSADSAVSPAPPAVVAMFGDSVPAWLLRDAASSYGRADVVIVNGTREACDGFDRLPDGRDRRGRTLRPPDDCLRWPLHYPAVLLAAPRTPDAAVLVIGKAPVLDRLIEGEWRHPCDGLDWYLADIARRAELFAERKIPLVVALPATPGIGANFSAPDDVAERVACVRAELFTFVGEQGLAVVDLNTVLCPAEGCDGTRVDGIHVKPELAPAVLDWLLDEALATLAAESSSAPA